VIEQHARRRRHRTLQRLAVELDAVGRQGARPELRHGAVYAHAPRGDPLFDLAARAETCPREDFL
jgi:hypothetical protein